MVTISFFSRTFIRLKGISAAPENLSSRLSRRPLKRAPFRKLVDQRVDRDLAAGDRAVDAFLGKQDDTFDIQGHAHIAQRLPQGLEIRQGDELIESSDLVRHGGVISAALPEG